MVLHHCTAIRHRAAPRQEIAEAWPTSDTQYLPCDLEFQRGTAQEAVALSGAAVALSRAAVIRWAEADRAPCGQYSCLVRWCPSMQHMAMQEKLDAGCDVVS